MAAAYRVAATHLRANRLGRLVQTAVQLTASGGGAARTLNLDASSANRWLEAAMAASFWELQRSSPGLSQVLCKLWGDGHG